ncbi:MAG: hypothetical protein JHC19_02605 [Desulfurococcaceae archaeon]|nr:hypothetical protein [Desulfurococcaceae archaeon]
MYQIFETIVFLIIVGIVVLVVAKLFMRDLRRKYDINIGRRMFITSLIAAFLMLLLISSIFCHLNIDIHMSIIEIYLVEFFSVRYFSLCLLEERDSLLKKLF